MTQLRARCTDAAPGEWSGLVAADPAATPAHRPELWRTLATVLPGLESRFIVVEREGAPVGGAPILIERRAGLCWLRALPFLLPAAPLARPGDALAVDEAVAHALLELQRGTRAVGGEWACYRPSGPAVAPGILDLLPGETRWFESAVVELDGGLDAALARADRKTRQGLVQSRESSLRFGENPDALDQAIVLNARQSRSWRGHRPVPAALSRRLIEAGVARLFTVSDDRGPLCATLALDGGSETLMWWSGAREEARARGAFALLAWSIAEWAHARGRARLNLGASSGLDPVAAFKRSLGARNVRWPVRWLSARHAPPAGRLVAALEARLRRGRARGAAA